MARKSTKVDELVELLKDEKSTELIVERLEESIYMSPKIEAMLEKKLDKIIDKILLKLDPIIDKKINDLLHDQLEVVQDNLTQIRDENTRLRSRISQLETEARLSDLVLHGVEESESATSAGSRDAAEKKVMQATLDLCNNTLGLTVSPADISLAYRLPKKGKEKHRPIVVKFSSMSIRNLVYRSRVKLRKTAIYINERLSPGNAQIYSKARALIKEGSAYSAWTAGGMVFIKLTQDPGCKPVKIASMEELLSLLPTSLNKD